MRERTSFSAAGSFQFLAPKEAPTTRPAGSTTIPTPSLEDHSARMFPARLRLTEYNMSVISITVSHAIEYFNSSVQAEIEAWPEGLKARYRALTIRMADHGPNLGMPHTRAMGRGLFEIRVKSAEGIGRAFYCALVGQRIVILHGYVKKTEKTPPKELRIARKRMTEVLHHGT